MLYEEGEEVNDNFECMSQLFSDTILVIEGIRNVWGSLAEGLYISMMIS